LEAKIPVLFPTHQKKAQLTLHKLVCKYSTPLQFLYVTKDSFQVNGQNYSVQKVLCFTRLLNTNLLKHCILLCTTCI